MIYICEVHLLISKLILNYSSLRLNTMMLKEERHTAKSIAFNVDLGDQSKNLKEPKIKKRLEEEAAAEPPQITLDKIKEKL